MDKTIAFVAFAGSNPTHSQLYQQTGHFATPSQMTVLIVVIIVALLAAVYKALFGN